MGQAEIKVNVTRGESVPQEADAPERDRRLTRATPLLVRQEGADGPGTLEGYAAVFNELSDPLGGFLKFREKIDPGAFDRTLSEDSDIRMLAGHDEHPSSVLASYYPDGGGTLKLSTDDTGLKFSAELPDTSTGRDLGVLVARGDIRQMSFGFTIREESVQEETDPEHDGTDLPIFTLQDVRLYEVSPVTWPAYPQTSVGVRSLVQQVHERRGASDRHPLWQRHRRLIIGDRGE